MEGIQIIKYTFIKVYIIHMHINSAGCSFVILALYRDLHFTKLRHIKYMFQGSEKLFKLYHTTI